MLDLCFALLSAAHLQGALDLLGASIPGRVGIAVQGAASASVHGQDRFPLESVMKLPVAIALYDAIDAGRLHLSDPVTLYPRDRALYYQPLAKKLTAKGYRTTLAELVELAVTQSDNLAADFLIAKLGGPKAVQACLDRKQLEGVRVDRDERHLQTEILGLTWQPAYIDEKVFNQAIDAVPPARRAAAFARHRQDPRDTATPDGVASLLHRLAAGELLSPASTAQLTATMGRTATGLDGLHAGLAPGWKLAHKTGHGGSWRGETDAQNDVGILTGPRGQRLEVAVFIADSRAGEQGRAGLMAAVVREAIAATL